MLELEELSLQIRAGPKQRSVQEFAPNRADQALNERMGKPHIRNRLDFCHLEDSKIGLPLVESVQRIVIRAEVYMRLREISDLAVGFHVTQRLVDRLSVQVPASAGLAGAK
jgi:hypothetical protein